MKFTKTEAVAIISRYCYDSVGEKLIINQNDVWAWASSYSEEVPDDQLEALASLIWQYGWAGVLFWVSERNNGIRSEFLDVNRMIDFVRHEENHRKGRTSSQAAYDPLSYTLSGEK